MGFEEDIKQWVALDSKIKDLYVQLKEHRAVRGNLGTQIYQYATTMNEDGSIPMVQISDGTLKFQQTKVTQPLTLKFIKGCLDEYLGSHHNVDEIMTYIKEQRDIRYIDDIKRYYIKDT